MAGTTLRKLHLKAEANATNQISHFQIPAQPCIRLASPKMASATTALPIMNKKELAASRYPQVIFEAGTMELRVA
jgi:hypothetical protein